MIHMVSQPNLFLRHPYNGKAVRQVVLINR